MPTLQLPCKVCEDLATGVHYGVLSCDACKGFFGRQLKSRGRHIVCPYNKSCKISKTSKKHVCAPCRFSKCLQVGMSKKAIRTGRYTQQLKQSFQTEIQKFEKRHAQQPVAPPPVKVEVKAASVDDASNTGDCDNDDDNDEDDDDDDEDNDDDYSEDDINYDSQQSLTATLNRLQPNTSLGVNGESLEEIIHAIVHAYPILPSSIKSPQEYLDKRAEEYFEQYQLKEKLFGKMSAVSVEEFLEIFSITGIDVDDRLPFTENYLNSVRMWVRKLVHFSRRIPGFKQLAAEDQLNLLRYNQCEFRFIGAYKGFNPKLGVAVNPNGFCFHKEEMAKIHPTGFNDKLFEVAKNLRRTNLTTEEHIIVQAMSLFFPDRAPLNDRAAVEDIQTMLLSCLEFLIDQRPSLPDRVRGLTHAMDMLTIIRNLSVDDKIFKTEGWISDLRNARWKFLEEEMENISHTGNFYTIL